MSSALVVCISARAEASAAASSWVAHASAPAGSAVTQWRSAEVPAPAAGASVDAVYLVDDAGQLSRCAGPRGL